MKDWQPIEEQPNWKGCDWASGESRAVYWCNLCRATFATYEAAQAHMIKQHRLPAPPPETEA